MRAGTISIALTGARRVPLPARRGRRHREVGRVMVNFT